MSNEESSLVDLSAEDAERQFPGKSEFVHLHNHTIFSLLDGVAKPIDYFKGCVDRKWPAFAITEHGVLSSIPDAYLSAKECGVKYLVGCEFYFCDYNDRRKKMQEQKIKLSDVRKDQPELASRLLRNRHLTVIAKNEEGYKTLLALNLGAYQDNFYYKPRISLEQLARNKKNIIVLSGCLNGPICHELRAGNISGNDEFIGAIEYVKIFQKMFGDDFYIELQMPGVEGEKEVFEQLVVIANHFKIKMIVANDCHYIQREDFTMQKVMMAIDQQLPVDSPDLFHVNSNEQYFKTRHELRASFKLRGFDKFATDDDFERACDNTLEIAEKCKVFKPDLGPKLPSLGDAESELRRLAEEGLRTKGLDKDETRFMIDNREVSYKEQMEIELERFIEKGFASYFLITRDLVMQSKSKGWPLGPARGSAGGSLVCYLLDIHELNPRKWKLSFNRFLSPSRGGKMLKITME